MTENYGKIIDIINAPAGLFYKVSTPNQGTFVVPAVNIVRAV